MLNYVTNFHTISIAWKIVVRRDTIFSLPIKNFIFRKHAEALYTENERINDPPENAVAFHFSHVEPLNCTKTEPYLTLVADAEPCLFIDSEGYENSFKAPLCVDSESSSDDDDEILADLVSYKNLSPSSVNTSNHFHE